MSWQLRIARPGLRVQMDLTRTLLICYRDIALSPDCPVGKKRKQWKKVEPWNGLRMVPETVSTVSTCQKLFLPVISPKKSLETISQILEPEFKKRLRLRGMGVESRASRETSNVEGHSTTLSIPVKRWRLARSSGSIASCKENLQDSSNQPMSARCTVEVMYHEPYSI